MQDLWRWSAKEISHAFLQGEVTAEKIVDTFLDRIHQHNSAIGAFLTVFDDRAKEQARALDKKRQEGKPLGKLAGVPVAIKDNIHIRGEKTTCASQFLTNYVAPFDATVTRLLEEADAVLVGKTNLDEFAMGSSTEYSALQETQNPWNLECSTGGSSGGSAAAVAARLVPVALGSDTGGSIRQPAAFCGVFGFKPTYGRVSRYGLVAFGSSLDQIGPMANSAEDIARIMEVIGAPCQRDSTCLSDSSQPYARELTASLEGIKIGVPRKWLEKMQDSSLSSFQQSEEQLKALGATLVDIELSLNDYVVAIYYILATAEASTNLSRFDGIRYGQRAKSAETLEEVYHFSRSEGFGPEVKRRIILGTFVLSAGYQDAYYRKAQKIRTLIIQEYQRAFSQCDLIVTPTTPLPAFQKKSIRDPLTMYLNDIFTIAQNLAGLPAISLPMGLSPEGLPLGLQFSGPQRGEQMTLRGAYAYEQSPAFSTLTPPLFS